MSMTKTMILSFCLWLGTPAFAGNVQHAHVHDVADLTLAMEGPGKWSVEFEAPTQVIYGFEHEPRNPSERTLEETGMTQMREKMSAMVILPDSADCRWKTLSVKTEKHHEGSGEHRELQASYHVDCKAPLKGSTVHFGFQTFFPTLKRMNVQVLMDNNQYLQVIRSGKDTLQIK